jgi:hypothetical protein
MNEKLMRRIEAVFEIAEELLNYGYRKGAVRKALIEPVYRALEAKGLIPGKGGAKDGGK